LALRRPAGFARSRSGNATREDAVTRVRIYRPAKSAMQSGRARTRQWVVEFEPGAATRRDALMGWAGGGDTTDQLRLRFATMDDAIAFARRRGLDYELHRPHEHAVKPKSYAENFRANRHGNWTH
jgi:NADH dehydrogenase ubiquinone Fe-S protein 4